MPTWRFRSQFTVHIVNENGWLRIVCTYKISLYLVVELVIFCVYRPHALVSKDMDTHHHLLKEFHGTFSGSVYSFFLKNKTKTSADANIVDRFYKM